MTANSSRAEISRIEDQLRHAFIGPAWHGDALMELLNHVPVDIAPAKPLEHSHSIWEIVLHIAAWFRIATQRVAGHALEPTNAQDWPAVIDVSDTAWSAALKALRNDHEKLLQAISRMQDAHLLKQVPGKDYDFYFLLHGVIQHTLYHAGQIAVLKKSSR